MTQPLILLGISAALVFLMSRAGVIDHPGQRSAHREPTPKGGGVGIVAAFIVGLIWADQAGQAGGQPIALAFAVLGLAGFSFMDDLHDWPFSAKLAAQLVAAALVVAGGYRFNVLRLPFGAAVATGGWGGALAIAWLLVVTNIVNFMDGLDGLVGGAALIACVFAAALSGLVPGVAAPALALGAGLLGFLPFNWPRARVFMGDVGSQPTGFVLGVLGIAASRGPAPGGALLMPLLLAPLLLDGVFTLARRLVGGARITTAHRGHLYQVAHRAGMPAPLVSAAYWGMTLVAGLLGWAMLAGPPAVSGWAPAAILLVFGVWAVVVVARAKRAGITRW